MNVRFPKDLEARIRLEAGRLQMAHPNQRYTLSDVVRLVLERELPILPTPPVDEGWTPPGKPAKGGRRATR